MIITAQDLYVLKKLKRMDDIAKSRRKPIAKTNIEPDTEFKDIKLKMHTD